MKSILVLFVKLFAFWLCFFEISRVIFIAFNPSPFLRASGNETLLIFKNGLPLDLSMTGYCVFFLALLYGFSRLIWKKRTLFDLGSYILIAVMSILILIDARLYHHWGYKLDYTAFQMLNTPKEVFASFAISDVLVAVIGIPIFLMVLLLAHQKLFKTMSFVRMPVQHTLVWLLLCAALIIPIRGGFGVATVGLSSAYFSKTAIYNHAAVNTPWNLIYATLNLKKTKLNYVEMSNAESEAILASLYPERDTLMAPFEPTQKVNVVMLVLESFSARLLNTYGGPEDVTPNLDQAAREGWVFSNFYASGDRSDKGLSSLYTGFPALPESSILRFPDRLLTMPNLYATFEQHGYHSSFIYGGNLDFANLRALFTSIDQNHIYEEDYFAKKNYRHKGKWGIHDEHTFSFLLEHVSNLKQPFFTSLYTLSSHQPFDIPAISKKYQGKDGLCYDAAWYTDSCIGVFLKELKSSELWKNTLVIITADHGIRQPGNVEVFDPEKFHIPLIFTGGVIKEPGIIKTYASHTDLPYSLQWWLLNEKDDQMRWSRSIFKEDHSFANFFYQIGSGYIDAKGCVVFDYNVDKTLLSTVSDSFLNGHLNRTKAYTTLVSDFFAKPH